jgi:hypothetical protein
MVYYSTDPLDRTFAALADPTRRALLSRLEASDGLSISELAKLVRHVAAGGHEAHRRADRRRPDDPFEVRPHGNVQAERGGDAGRGRMAQPLRTLLE